MKLRFNELPQRVREQLVAVTTGQGDPRVLASSAGFGAGWFKWVTAVGGLVATGYCFDFLWRRGQEVDPYHDREVYLGLAAALFVLIASVIGIVYTFVWKAPPYKEGLYVFYSGLVKLRHGEVDIMPIQELGRPTIVQVRRNGVYQHTRLELGGPFTFYFNGQTIAEQTCTAILHAKVSFIRMLAAKDDGAIYQVDPFAECTISGQWKASPGPVAEPTAPFIPPAARWGRWIGAIVGGIALSGVLYLVMDGSFASERDSSHRDAYGPRH
jgi:hypothetical protein